MFMETIVYHFLTELSIEFREYRHPPVNTVAEAEKVWQDIPGIHCKNLFLRDHKGKNHFLVIMPAQKVLDMKKLAAGIGKGRLSFASPQRLQKYLGLTPGSVSPFGLINDTEHRVLVYIDQELQNADRLGFHPNINTITITLAQIDFERFMKKVGNEVTYIDI